MRTRTVLGAITITILFGARAASAAQPERDGMNCADVPWIKGPACAAWMNANAAAQQKWWVRFSEDTGHVRSIYANRGGKVPGIDLAHITRESARADQATQALLTAYAKKRIRVFDDALGIHRNAMHDLVFSDFRSEPAETFTQGALQNGELVELTTTSPVVYHIQLQQIADAWPVVGAGVTVTVDAENDLLGIHSTYRPEDLEPGQFRLGPDDAVTAALAGTGIDLADLISEPSSVPTWIARDGELLRAWNVGFEAAIGNADVSIVVFVRDQTREVLEKRVLDSTCAVILGADPLEDPPRLLPTGFRDGTGDVIPETPLYFDDPGFNRESVIAAVQEVPLRDMCTWSGPLADDFNGRLSGKYVRVDQRLGEDHVRPSYVHRVDFREHAIISYDFDPAGFVGPFGAVEDIEVGLGPDVLFFDDTDSANHLDETQVYFHVDRVARYFDTRFHSTLSRADNTNPDIEVRVNSRTSGGPRNADNSISCEWDWTSFSNDCTSKLRFGPGTQYQPVENDYTIEIHPDDTLTRDVYTRLDFTRDPGIIAHEFTHAMIYDVSGIFGGPDHHRDGSFHEGMADYFAATLYQRPAPGRWVRVFRTLELNPANPLIYPDVTEDEVHADGRFIGRPLWRLRARLEQLKEEIPLLSYGRSAADRIAFGVMNRVGDGMNSFREPLADALSADADTYGKLFHYEIMAAFAWHGIKLEPGIAVIEPEHFMLDGRPVATGGAAPILRARAFLGENTVYVAEFSTSPLAFGPLNPNQEPDRNDPEFNYIMFTSLEPTHPQPAPLPSDTADGGFNNVVDFEIPYDDLELLTQGENQATIFMHVTTVGAEGVEFSHVEGAGRFLTGAEHPFTLYIATSAPAGGCTCSTVPGRQLPYGPFALLGLTAIVAVLRRQRE